MSADAYRFGAGFCFGEVSALHSAAARSFGATQHPAATPWQLCDSNWAAVRVAITSVFAAVIGLHPAQLSPATGLVCPI